MVAPTLSTGPCADEQTHADSAASPRVLAGLRVRSGVDLVAVSDVDNAVTQFGDRYLERVFTAHERESCQGSAQAIAEGLAARFAAKEAALKVLRPCGAIDWREVEVRRGDEGACTLELHGQARRMAEQAGVLDISVALSHEGDVATAVVVALCWSAHDTASDATTNSTTLPADSGPANHTDQGVMGQ